MKKSTIWILCTVMSVSFIILLLLQITYMRDTATSRRQQFEESVKRSLYQVAHTLELEETRKYLEQDMARMENQLQAQTQNIISQQTYTFPDGSTFSVQQSVPQASLPSLQIPNPDRNRQSGQTVQSATSSRQEALVKRYITQRALTDEVIYSMLVTAGNRPLRERVDPSVLANELSANLLNNGVDLPFHYTLSTTGGRVVYSCDCEDFDAKDMRYSYSQTVFRNDAPNRMAVVRVYFPTLQKYLSGTVRFMVPSFIFLIVLLVSFIFTLLIVFRQKKLTEIKNDFINNMTHEFKTPISTISLAAQMLNDQTVAKSPQMFQHISGVITDETKRLRFQVEKVLQMSMFERQSSNLKLKDTDVNELIAGVVKTFTLKVENCGGSIDTSFDAEQHIALTDEMHFTNVIFNLMDNAVKYKRQDVDLHLEVRTWNESGRLMVSIADNGIGIKKDDLKKIFDKFYRVHTGNLHDVKGFGLGLAYVKKIITDHRGTIRAESELGEGTKFIISLPVLER